VNTHKLAGAVAAVVLAMGLGTATAAPAFATDNIKIFGEKEHLNNPDGTHYVTYIVGTLKPSNDPVPHNGKLYSATLNVTGGHAMIERFGARAENGTFYPSIWGASNLGKLYFDVVGPVPNSVVWNDGVRDILAWVPGETPLGPEKNAPDLPTPEDSSVIGPSDASQGGGAAPAEASGNLGEATPDVLAPPPFQLTEGEVASPGFNAR
jgi:hypothetical protein